MEYFTSDNSTYIIKILGAYKVNQRNLYMSSVHAEMPHLLHLTEHHLSYLDLNYTYTEHYNLDAEYCTQIPRQGGVGMFNHEKL
jgi:hypothetical protein